MERDRAWFEVRPGETVYLRQYITGEFPPEALAHGSVDMLAQDTLIRVERLAPGIRTRMPIIRKEQHS